MSDSESATDTFEGTTHSDSDEDYVPEIKNLERNNLNIDLDSDSDASASDENADPNLQQVNNFQPGTSTETPQRGRKKLRRKKIWKRSVRKAKRIQGKSYENIAGRIVQEKRLGANCVCRLKCMDNIGQEGCQKLFSNFYSMQTKDLQDAYLFGGIERKSVARPRPRSGDGHNKNSSYVYKIRHGGNSKIICKKGFLSVHGISKSRLERLQKHLNENGTPPVDLRGRYLNRTNKLPENIIENIRQHILSFPRYRSHYSRADNLNHYYLSPFLSISKMHDLYLKKYEPETADNPTVKYEYFRKYFVENFKISFGKPKSDTCQKCDKLSNKIDAADCENDKKKLETEKQLHIIKAETFYTDLKAKTNLAKNDPQAEVLTFDFQQNLPLPVCPSGEVFYKIQLWVFNFCIHVASTGTSYFFLYNETLGGKGQNEVVSMLLHFVNNHVRPEVKNLYIFSDNCASQNKNNVLVQFLYSLVETEMFTSIYHRYPEPGHSFLPCDRSFGAIEIKKRKYDRIYLPDEYANIIKSARKDFSVIHVTQEMFLDFKNHFQQFFVKNPSKSNNKYTLSKYRIICYNKNGTDTLVKCSETVRMPVFSTFQIKNKKNLTNVSLPAFDQKLYLEKRKLKKKKLEHVMTLAQNYVPKCDMWFYNDIEQYHNSFEQSDKDTSASEYDEDDE